MTTNETSVLVRFRDLSVPDEDRKAILSTVDDVLQRGELILGDEVAHLEAELAASCNVKYAVGVSNGTGALYLALRGLGIGAGDEVITSPMSWVATANAILALGATPVYADVTDDYVLDTDAVEAALSPRTAAIVPVHFYGRLVDMPRVIRIAERHGVAVVEDAAQAFGATRGHQPAGSFGNAGAFSLNPMKPLAALGEAGAVLTNDAALADKVRSLRYLGTQDRETCIDPSLNFKIDALQAAVLRMRLPHVESVLEHRNRIAAQYTRSLSDVVVVPTHDAQGRHAFFDYTIWTDRRDALEAELLRRGIEVKVRHRLLLCDQPAYSSMRQTTDIPNARRLVVGILSLPIHERLTPWQLDYVIESVRSALV